MSDEPRRSVRATKGQHTKSLDILDPPSEPTKKRGGKRGATKKAASQETASNDGDGDTVRCVCGATETDDDSDENWICCESCAAWQHNVCVGMPEEVPDSERYWCEQCKPENHKELLAAEAEGRHLWQERRRVYAEAKKKRKGGKKGKGKRNSDQRSDGGAAQSPAPEGPEIKKEKKEVPLRTAKRKSRDDSQESTGKAPQTKIRRVSAQSKSSDVPETAQSIDQLDKSRQGVATFIHKNMLTTVRNAVKQGTFTSSDSKTPEEVAMRMALLVEAAIHDSHGKEAYVTQSRAVGFALQRNHKLYERLQDGDLSPDTLASMSPEDMATDEMKQKTAEMMAKAERQSTMIQDDAPRIRRTHKGDEVVEEDPPINPAEDTATVRRSMLDPNSLMGGRSRDGSPDEMDAADPSDERRTNDIRVQTTLKGSSADGSDSSPVRRPSQPANFDIKKIMSSVPSPSQPHPRRPSTARPPRDGPGVDPDIDRMLDDGNQSDEYEPAEHDADPSVVWRGSLTMDGIAHFPAVARHVGGADLSRADPQVPWTDLLDKQLTVAGRTHRDQASEYLCSLRYSVPTDVVVVELSPAGDAASEEFMKLYNYFYDKKRCGVLGNRSFANVRDTYLVPVAPGADDMPEFMMNLQENKLAETREAPTLLVTLVVRSDVKQSTDQGQGTPASAVSASQRQMSISGPSMSPVTTQSGHSPYATTPSHSAPSTTPKPTEQSLDAARRKQEEDQRRGVAAAQNILGPLLHTATVGFILPQAHKMHPVEWTVIRDVLLQHPRARDDLSFLSTLLSEEAPANPPATAPSATAAAAAATAGVKQ